MRTPAIALLLLLALAACREEEAAVTPDPVTMSEEALGFYCQMTLAEHPGPKGQIHLRGMPAPIFFSQVRDAVAYLRMPEQSHAVTAVYVSDMGSAESWDAPGASNWIAADSAHFVVGSDRIGGMGAPELVPFADRAAAERFTLAHGGTVLALDEIDDRLVLEPVEFDAGAIPDGMLAGHPPPQE